MLTIRRIVPAVICCSLLSGTSANAAERPGAELSQRFASALQCDKPEAERSSEARALRQWCSVTSLSEESFLAPPARRTLVGVSIRLKAGQDVLEALRAPPELAVLTFDPKGALVTSLRPSDVGEKKPLTGTLATVNGVLKRKQEQIYVSKKTSKHLKALEREPLHPYEAGRKGAFEGLLPARISSVKGLFGEGYVVVEEDEGLQRINLFPIAPIEVDDAM